MLHEMPMSQARSFYIVGGTLPTDATCYVKREADTRLYSHLRAGKFSYVLNTRQMGKSSLMVRTAQLLREQGVRVVLLDLTAIGLNLSVEAWYDGLLTLIGEQLPLRNELEDFWLDHTNLGPMQRWVQALRHVVLERSTQPLCIFIDEIDAIRSLPFSTDEFFAGIRECYNRRTQDPVFERLTFCLLGVAAPIDLISNPLISPFNIGERIVLSDFMQEEATPLALGFCRPEGEQNTGVSLFQTALSQPPPLLTAQQSSALNRVLYWTGGHPYLTQRLCEELARQFPTPTRHDVDSVCRQLFLGKRAQRTDDNLIFVRTRLLHNEASRAAILDLYRLLLRGHKIVEDATDPRHIALQLAGIVRVQDGTLVVRNRIYAHVFDLNWALANMPGEEIRRQKAAFRRGALRSAAVFGSLAALIATLFIVAVMNVHRAHTAEAHSAHSLYISDINMLQREWESGNIAHAMELLDETGHSSEKGLEWNYWERQCHKSVHTLVQGQQITAVAVIPGKNQVIVLDAKGRLKLWDIETGRLLRTLERPTDHCEGMACSPDGKRLFLGVKETIQVRDTQTWGLLRTLPGYNGPVQQLIASPDGTSVAALTITGCVSLWNADTGERQLISAPNSGKRTNSIYGAVPVGADIVLFHKNGLAEAHAMKTGQDIWHKQFSMAPGGVAFSHDGKRLVGRDKNGNISVVDAQTGRQILYLTNQAELQLVRFSHGDRQIIAVQRGTINVWDAHSGVLLDTFREHTEQIVEMDSTSDDRYLVSGAYDGTTKVWDLRLPTNPLTLSGSRALWDVMYSPDDTQVVTSSDNGDVTLWAPRTGRKIRTFSAGKVGVIPAVFTHDGTCLFTGDQSGNGCLWNVQTGALVQRFHGSRTTVNAAVFSPDDRFLYTANDDFTALQWDVATGKIVHRFVGHLAGVETVALSHDGTRLFTGSEDYKVIEWDVRSGQPLYTFNAPGQIWGIALSPDDTRLAIGNLFRTVEVWDVASHQRVFTLHGHTGWVVRVAFSPDGKYLATSSRDTTAKIWEMTSGREVLALKGHTNQISGLAFSGDGHIATAGADGKLILWDVSPLKLAR